MNDSSGRRPGGSDEPHRLLNGLPSDSKGATRDCIDRLIDGSISQINFSTTGLSGLDTSMRVKVRLFSRRVDDDGTFSEEDVREHHLVLLILQSETAGRLIKYSEAVAWRDELLPNTPYSYLIDGFEHDADTADRWFFAFFIESGKGTVRAPSDFDWIKHRVGSSTLRISLLGEAGQRHTLYEQTDFSGFYHSYSESRGRFWDLTLDLPPEESDITTCFNALSKAIARRGALGEGLRPVSLRWTGGNTADLMVSDESSSRCFSLVLQLPTDSELESGRYVPRKGSPIVTTAEQYSAGEVYRIREMSRAGMSAWAPEVRCPDR